MGVEAIINLAVPFFLIVTTYFIGGAIERRHYRSIRAREVELQGLPAVTFREPPASWEITDSRLVTGSTVVSVDYFKRFLAGLRNLFGGEIRSYEPLLDRARREALLRMKAQARRAHVVVNVRLETSSIGGQGTKKGLGSVEVMAYGTAIQYAAENSR